MTFLDQIAQRIDKALDGDCGYGAGGYLAEQLAPLIAEHDAKVRAEAIREYVAAARENPHTLYWPASGVLDDAEQWADEIEKGTI